MKNLILIIGMFVATSSMAQFTESTTTPKQLNEQRTRGKCYAKLLVNYTDTTYMLWIRDTQYSHIVSSFTYSGSKSEVKEFLYTCLLYTSPSPRDVEESRMPSSA